MSRSASANRRPAKVFAAALLAACTAIAAAEPAQPANPERENADVRKVPAEIYGGVVTNQTITVAGHNFYQYFVASWRNKDVSERYAISIHERPSVAWGSQVWIEYAQTRVFQASLPTSVAKIKELSEQAAGIAQQKVVDVEVGRLLFREAEFGPDEI